MKRHYFEPSGDAGEEGADVCELCGETVDSAIHEMDGEPPDDDGAPDVPAGFPPTPAALFDAAGLRNPPGT